MSNDTSIGRMDKTISALKDSFNALISNIMALCPRPQRTSYLHQQLKSAPSLPDNCYYYYHNNKSKV